MQGFRPRGSRFLPAAVAFAALAGLPGCDDPTSPGPVVRIAVAGGAVEVPYVAPVPPKLDALTPPCVGRLDAALVRECSGFAASHRHPGVFWTFSDSGDTNRLFAVRADGTTVKPAGTGAYAGIKIPGAENHDWEAAAVAPDGRLIIGDFGNNSSSRKKLRLFVLPAEPDPTRVAESAPARVVRFHYCDQQAVPDPKKNHDAEAMFCLGDAVYVLTKHWTDHDTELHRIDLTGSEAESKPTTLVARFHAGGMVTDAAVSPSGRRLAILTYSGVWVFELPARPADHPLSGRAFFRPLSLPTLSWQVEAVAFSDENTLLVGSEEGALFRVRFEELSPVPHKP